MLKIATILLTTFATMSLPVYADEELTFPAHNLQLIDIQNAQGNIHVESVTGSGNDNVSVKLTKGEYLNSCRFTTELKSRRLVIISKANNKLFGKDICKLDIAVKIPKSMDLELRVGSGDVAIENVSGLVDYKIGSGNLSLKNVTTSKMIGRTGSGDVSVEGTIEEVDLKIGAGDVSLTYRTTPVEGSVEVKIGSGTTTVVLPENSSVSSKFKSGTGSLTNEFQNNSNAKFKISGTTGTGDMVIKKM